MEAITQLLFLRFNFLITFYSPPKILNFHSATESVKLHLNDIERYKYREEKEFIKCSAIS